MLFVDTENFNLPDGRALKVYLNDGEAHYAVTCKADEYSCFYPVLVEKSGEVVKPIFAYYSAMENKIKNLEEELTNAKNQLINKDKKVEELLICNNNQFETIVKRDTCINDLKKELDRMSKLNKLKDEKINELSSQVNHQTRALTDRNIRIEKLENEITKIKGVRNVEPVEYRFEGFGEWKENLKKRFDIQKEVTIPENADFIEMTKIDFARFFATVEHVHVNPFLNFDFSDHKTINGFLKNHFQVQSCGELVNMIDALEKSYKLFNDRSTRYERAGVTMNYLFTHWEGLGSLTRDEEKELAKYVWNREHPFSYTIVAKPNEEDSSIMEYYVVFNSAPEYIGKRD